MRIYIHSEYYKLLFPWSPADDLWIRFHTAATTRLLWLLNSGWSIGKKDSLRCLYRSLYIKPTPCNVITTGHRQRAMASGHSQVFFKQLFMSHFPSLTHQTFFPWFNKRKIKSGVPYQLARIVSSALACPGRPTTAVLGEQPRTARTNNQLHFQPGLPPNLSASVRQL